MKRYVYFKQVLHADVQQTYPYSVSNPIPPPPIPFYQLSEFSSAKKEVTADSIRKEMEEEMEEEKRKEKMEEVKMEEKEENVKEQENVILMQIKVDCPICVLYAKIKVILLKNV